MMRTKQTQKRNCNFIFCILLVAISLPSFASAYSNTGDTAVFRKLSGNKSQSIQLFSSSGKQTLLFSAKLKQKKIYRFYMFDMDGKLVAENDLVNKQGVEFTNMQKGDYYFEILMNDDQIEKGTLTIK
jgi:hypothetical protein